MSSIALDAELEERLARLARAWSDDPDVAAEYLYGSRARGRARAESDVDIGVVLRADLQTNARWHKRLALIDEALRERLREGRFAR